MFLQLFKPVAKFAMVTGETTGQERIPHQVLTGLPRVQLQICFAVVPFPLKGFWSKEHLISGLGIR